MGNADPSGPNADQIRYWNEVSGPKWRAHQRVLDRQLGPLGREVMERARIVRGERVLDVGCGCGDTTLELARLAGQTGSALGVDVSEVMLEAARDGARAAGIPNAAFLAADAQTENLGPERFDLVYSRFGVMFFADPVAAFANLRRCLRRGGRLAFVCWQPLDRNPWMRVPLGAAAPYVALPPPPGPDAPGPFSFGDPDRVRRILGGAGFGSADVVAWTGSIALADGSLAGALQLVFEIGPLAALLREQGAGPEVRRRVEQAVKAALAPYETRGGLQMPAAAWIVEARP